MKLTSEEVRELKQIQRNVSGNGYIRVMNILMLNRRFAVPDISESLGVDVSIIHRYAAPHRTGASGLAQANHKG